ncbi:MAG TPA: hypothetical protein VFZ09_18470 [Archangium sp.]|uniref:hypothetical protein n=1 Tax=Archangium sp. TaxID=1872627 RepID=UPI002E3488AC|nr:hypothetical protein [Archangium sp.]HEX5748230.1 hypothetical protein [Archangium sp.]
MDKYERRIRATNPLHGLLQFLHLVPRWQAPPLPMSLLYPYARFYPARLRAFVEWMRETIPAAVAAATGAGEKKKPVPER